MHNYLGIFSLKNHLRRYPLVALSVAALSGIYIADAGTLPLWLWFTGFALGGLTFFLTQGGRQGWAVLLATSSAFAAMHAMRIQDPITATLTKELAERPRMVAAIRGKVIELRKGNDRNRPAVVAVDALQLGLDNHWNTVPKISILLRWPNELPIDVGWEVEALGSLQQIAPPSNPGTFDAKAWWFRRNVSFELYVAHPRDVASVKESSVATGGILELLRKRIHTLLSVGIADSPETVTILNGIMLGDLGDPSEEWLDQVRVSGLMHLFAVSGLNVGMIAAIGWVLVSMLPIPRSAAALLVFGLVLLYAAVAGFSASVLRATIMAGAIILGLVIRRRAFLINSIAGAALIILLFNTNEAFQIGFQLSFLVVMAIAVLATPLSSVLEKRLMPDPFLPRRLYNLRQRLSAASARSTAGAAAATFAAWLGSLPLIWLHFHMISPVALLVNLPAVPIGFFLLAFALLSIVGGCFFTPLAGVFNNASWLVTQALLGLVSFANVAPGGYWYAGLPRVYGPDYICELTFYSVDRGQARLLHTNNRAWLIDCGTEQNVRHVLTPSLHAQGINRLDGIFYTQTDVEHLGGLDLVRTKFAPRQEIFGGEFHGTAEIAENVSLDPAIPGPPTHARTGDDRVIPILLRAGRWKILIMGSAGFQQEALLLQEPDLPPVDVLVQDGNQMDPGSDLFPETLSPRVRIGSGEAYDLRRDGAVTLTVYANRIEVKSQVSGEVQILRPQSP